MARSAAAVRVFSDDGRCVHDARLMRRALEYVKAFDAVIAQHAQDPRLADAAACAHEGELSGRLGLAGWPACGRGVDRRSRRHARRAHRLAAARLPCLDRRDRRGRSGGRRQRGIAVTAEVTPHHLLLTCDLLEGYDPVYKVNPPLRPAEDVEALRAGLADGDDRCGGHRSRAARRLRQGPRLRRRRVRHARSADRARRGGPGDGRDRASSTGPAWRTGCRSGRRPSGEWPGTARAIEVGAPANLTLVDPAAAWTVDPAALASKSRNTPYAGRTLPARVVATMLRGRLTVSDSALRKAVLA